MWVVVVLLIGVYLFPLWQIGLQAPQYPDGLGINIWLYKITGATEHDLQNINGLNHYISMKVIDEADFPELRYMKFILAGLIVLAMVVALARKWPLLLGWAVLAVGLSVLGMYDFYRWEYAYGHDLDPNAAIKIPGMSYQPPLFGTKILLNFTATAWPGIGGMCAMLGVGLGSLMALYEMFRRRGRRGGARSASSAAAALFICVVGLTFTGCNRDAQPIEYGSDLCVNCKMTISDERYGAEIVTSKGRAYKYDSIECMAMAVQSNEELAEAGIHGLYVTDFMNPGTFTVAGEANYLRSPKLPSPMGMNLTAFASETDADAMQKERGGDLMDWSALVEVVSEGR